MHVLFIAFLVLLSAVDCCGAARRRQTHPAEAAVAVRSRSQINPYQRLFEEFSKEEEIDISAGMTSAEGEEAKADSRGIVDLLNTLFDQTDDIFTDKSYFFKLFAEEYTPSDQQNSKKESRAQFRKELLAKRLTGDVFESFRLLIDLDAAQDSGDHKAFTRCVEAIFINSDEQLKSVRDYYKDALIGANLKKFIRRLDEETFFCHETTLVKSLLSHYESDATPQEKAAFDRTYGKIFGKLGDVEAKIATPYSLCLSGLGCIGGVIGGSLAFAYNTSTSSLTGSDITRVVERIVSIIGNDTETLNTTRISEEVFLEYEKASSFIPQNILGTGLLLGGALSGYKFIHDVTFWWNSSRLKYGLEWLSLYVMSYPESRGALSEMVPRILEAALQRQGHFLGSPAKKSKFLINVMNEIDAHQLRREG